MKISLELINELAPTLADIDAQTVAEQLTLKSAEVEGVSEVSAHLETIRVVQVQKVAQHPSAERLKLVSFELDDRACEVVCGAPNVRAGMKAAFAPVGIQLPNGMTLEARKIRGVLSSGMLCSEAELEIGEDSSGIWEAPSDAPEGISLAAYLEAPARSILDIDNKSITHRADLWGHLGFAREIAALFGRPFENSFHEAWASEVEARCTTENPPVSVRVEQGCACRAYFGLSIDGVDARPSPLWLQRRLADLGLRPINALVDIGNYAMLELGAPLHVFDRAQISGSELVIRSVTKPEELLLLDGSKAKLDRGDTVVADERQSLVLAGIMGGVSSGVEQSTTEIFIEAASWDASWVRKCSSRLGLRTDSSMRFEKHMSSAAARVALLRATELVLQLFPDARIVGELQSDGPEVHAPPSETVIDLRPARASAVLGITVTEHDCTELLSRLECEVLSRDSESMKVRVPSFRAGRSLTIEEDLIEEIGRLHGYDKIPVVSTHAIVTPAPENLELKVARSIRNFLVFRSSALEVFTSPLIGEKVLDDVQWPHSQAELLLFNALSVDRDRMRQSLLPQFIEVAALNARHFSHFRTFELGRVYHPSPEQFAKEEQHLALAYYSKTSPTFNDIAEDLEELLQSLGVQCATEVTRDIQPFIPHGWNGLHPTQSLQVRAFGKAVAAVCTLHPSLLRKLKFRGHCSFCLLNVSSVTQHRLRDRTSYTPFSTLPSSDFDISVRAKRTCPVSDILRVAQKLKVSFLEDLRVVDIFPLEADYKSVTVRFRLHNKERTLSPEEIQSTEQQIIAGLSAAGFPLR